MLVQSAVDNNGQLISNGGNFTLQGAVTVDGTATIGANSTVKFGAASSANVAFSALSGVLRLDQSRASPDPSPASAVRIRSISATSPWPNTTLGYAANSGNNGGNPFSGLGPVEAFVLDKVVSRSIAVRLFTANS